MMEGLQIRRAEIDDIERIKQLVGDNDGPIASAVRSQFGIDDEFDILHLIELSFLSVTAIDNRGELVGFATFNDSPPNLHGKAADADS